jgi:hypothetical protein
MYLEPLVGDLALDALNRPASFGVWRLRIQQLASILQSAI